MPFILKFNGGPADGTRVCDRLEDYNLSWPLPDTLDAPGGVYSKLSESQLPPSAADHPNVGVGAEYDWKPNEEV